MTNAVLGFGLGLRPQHYSEILSRETQIDWFEAISENFLGLNGSPKGRALEYLLRVREQYPVVLHGVSMSIGSASPLNWEYLKALKELYQIVQPAWISDHLCWTEIHGIQLHDLMPLPYNDESIEHLTGRIQEIQEFLGRTLVLENVSSYLSYKNSTHTEWDFIKTLCKKSGAKILLDINNVYVSSVNHAFNPKTFLDALDPTFIQQIHLAGHSQGESLLVDTHDEAVCKEVWNLYRYFLEQKGFVSTMIERDAKIPELHVLEEELHIARNIWKGISTYDARTIAI